ncbi:NUMOD4 domain-containing protein [Ferrovum sp.]|uniref:NUMOD4 domain-containing protein n=1 Tax=Ferrovum sp. TaxID=2609467 RepID=UPI00260DE9DA|nr:NUMOD4 domain-containing protein [Ferrovum sp.]
MSEFWKDVVGYEGRYEVSNYGRIKSLTFRGHKRKVPKILKQAKDGFDGRLKVNLSPGKNNGRRKVLKVHHLVLAAFSGPRQAGNYGCHNDGDYLNNCATNLRWDTPKANQNDRLLHGTGNNGERNPNSKLTNEDVLQIKVALLKYRRGDVNRLADKYSVSRGTISDIKRGRTWI